MPPIIPLLLGDETLLGHTYFSYPPFNPGWVLPANGLPDALTRWCDRLIDLIAPYEGVGSYLPMGYTRCLNSLV